MITVRCPECGKLVTKRSSQSLLECPRCGCDLSGETMTGVDEEGY